MKDVSNSVAGGEGGFGAKLIERFICDDGDSCWQNEMAYISVSVAGRGFGLILREFYHPH